MPLNKSARELRQGGSDYRCCIPALAGFVSPQSIAPDGKQISSQESERATPNSESFREENRRIDNPLGFCLHRRREMAGVASGYCSFGAANSCTTLVDRRDLYSPEPAPDSLEAARQWYGITTTSTTTRTRRPS